LFNLKLGGNVMNYKIVWEIELEANSPLEAAKIAHKWQQDYQSECTQFYVQAENESELFSVDLMEDDEDAVLPVTEYIPIISRKS
jgi:hypothetical protein